MQKFSSPLITSNSSSELCWSYSNKFDWGVKNAGDSDEQAVSVGDVVSCLELMPKKNTNEKKNSC